MRRTVVSLAAGAALVAGGGVTAIVTAGGSSASVAGCSTNFEGQTEWNDQFLPGPYVHPPVVGVTEGDPTLWASNEEFFAVEYAKCVAANPGGGL